ncbi:MAG: glycosyl transferase [Sphingobacteriaceae bacterium]|nr:glycosyl transferase [Sphingobacteriaceae bacterium]
MGKPKIFYAVQATGNGHLSRAQQLYPYLEKMGDVDFFISGNNANLDFKLPIKYRSKGCSLHYSKCGGLNYLDLIKNIKPLMIYKDARNLPLKKYDIIINDFDVVTSLACKLQKIPSVQLGHQASFQSKATPRPDKKSIMGETILKHYAHATNHIGFHFQKYDSFILPPVIKNNFIHAETSDLKHVTIYLPSFQKHCLLNAFSKLPNVQFHWFLGETKSIYKENNITYYPINQNLFDASLLSCHGLITGGGFETPAEALYLGKKLISIPIKDHYEQQCNAAALKKLGVTVLQSVEDDFSEIIEKWYHNNNENPKIEANNISETLQLLFDTYPQKKENIREDALMFI